MESVIIVIFKTWYMLKGFPAFIPRPHTPKKIKRKRKEKS
jgi:hypothetical protein